MASLTDRELMELFWKLKPDEREWRALTYLSWKDGIDINVPTVFLRRLADAIAERSLVDRPAPLDAPPDAPENALEDQSQALRQSGAAASAETERDAARYRWLREWCSSCVPGDYMNPGAATLSFQRLYPGTTNIGLRPNLDDAIDAAMRAAVPQQHSEPHEPKELS